MRIRVRPVFVVIFVPAALVQRPAADLGGFIGKPMRRSHGRKTAALPGFKLCAHQFRPLGGQPVISGSVDRLNEDITLRCSAGGPGPSAAAPSRTVGWSDLEGVRCGFMLSG